MAEGEGTTHSERRGLSRLWWIAGGLVIGALLCACAVLLLSVGGVIGAAASRQSGGPPLSGADQREAVGAADLDEVPLTTRSAIAAEREANLAALKDAAALHELDDFSDGGPWINTTLDDDFGIFRVTKEEGVYLWRLEQDRSVYRQIFRDYPSDLGDFILSVDAELSEGLYGYFGLLFHVRSRQDLYLVSYDPVIGAYFGGIALDGPFEPLATDRVSIEVMTSEVQNLTILGIDDHYEIFINGHFVDAFDDSTFRSGAVGLIAGTYDDVPLAEFRFDNFEYYDLSER